MARVPQPAMESVQSRSPVTNVPSKPGRRLGPGALEKSEALELYRKLIVARLAEEKIRQEYSKDQMKTPVHLGIGQEAIAVGVCSCLPAGSKTFGTYRNHALYLAVTEDTDAFFGELYGKVTGPGRGKAGSMHLSAPERGLLATSAVVGTTIPLAVGAALAHAYRKSDALAAVFFGDGALEEGVFWESLNFACLRRLRVLLVCEDNGLAIHTPTSQRQGFRSIEEVLKGFRCHVASGNGSDLLDVIRTTRTLLARMAQEAQPGFLHLTYFRFLEHVGPREDFEAGYRRAPSPEERTQRDPVARFEQELCRNGCSSTELAAIKQSVVDQLARSLEGAQRAAFASSSELHTDVFAE